MANHHNHSPRLRSLNISAAQSQGQPVLVLNDPMQLGDNYLVLPQALGPALSMMDGEHDLASIHILLELQYGVSLEEDLLDQLLAVLDENLMLENARSAEAMELELTAYRSAPFRPPMMAGQSYPAESTQLASFLDRYLAGVNGADPAAAAGRGLISPHIDYPRGGHVYAATWARARAMANEADLVVMLGTDHYSTGDRFTLTSQNYATPFGLLPTDIAVVEALADAIGQEAAFAGELRHRGEHSLELVATWLHHMRGGRPVAMVPVLTGSFGDFINNGCNPGSDPMVRAFLDALGRGVAGRNVLFVASGDLAHVGPAFGGNPLNSAGKDEIRAADDNLLDCLSCGDAEGFFGAIRQVRDRNNVCGVSPFYLMLSALEDVQGRPVAYDQCPADDQDTSIVSVCGMVFD